MTIRNAMNFNLYLNEDLIKEKSFYFKIGDQTIAIMGMNSLGSNTYASDGTYNPMVIFIYDTNNRYIGVISCETIEVKDIDVE